MRVPTAGEGPVPSRTSQNFRPLGAILSSVVHVSAASAAPATTARPGRASGGISYAVSRGRGGAGGGGGGCIGGCALSGLHLVHSRAMQEPVVGLSLTRQGAAHPYAGI